MRFKSFSQLLPAVLGCAGLAACSISGTGGSYNDGRVDVSTVTLSSGARLDYGGVQLGAGDSLGMMLFSDERLARLKQGGPDTAGIALQGQPDPVDPTE